MKAKAVKKGAVKTRKPRRNSIAVTQYKKNGKRVKSYPSINDAYEKTGVNVGSISKAVRRIILSAGGFLWERKF